MMNNFYTYIYLDPRKPGLYNYGDYTFEYEPFYVGKGKNEQWLAHLKEAKGNINLDLVVNKHKFYKIKNILQENLEPIILKIDQNLLEKEAFDLEVWMIWIIGREDIFVGPLTNHSSGGDGASGAIRSEKTKEKLSKANKGQIPWHKGKVGVYSFEALNKMSKAKKGKPSQFKGKTGRYSSETLNKMSKAQKLRKMLPVTLETRVKLSSSGKASWVKRKLKKGN